MWLKKLKHDKLKAINYKLNRKGTIIRLIVGLIKKHSINVWTFSKTEIFRRKKKVELGLPIFVTKADGIDTADFA